MQQLQQNHIAAVCVAVGEVHQHPAGVAVQVTRDGEAATAAGMNPNRGQGGSG